MEKQTWQQHTFATERDKTKGNKFSMKQYCSSSPFHANETDVQNKIKNQQNHLSHFRFKSTQKQNMNKHESLKSQAEPKCW